MQRTPSRDTPVRMFTVVPPAPSSNGDLPVETGGELDIRALLGVLRRHVRLILSVLGIVLALACVALFTLKPVYTASTLVMVDPSHKDLLNPEDVAQNASADSARVDSEVELVKSETTLLRVIKENNLVTDPELGVSLGLKDKILAFLRVASPQLPTGDEALQIVVRKLRDAINVQRRGLTYLITIDAKSTQPATAARLANAMADAYIKDQVEAKINATLASRDILQARIRDASATVAKSEDAFDSFISDNIERISAETGRTDLLQIRKDLEAAIAKRTDAARVVQLIQTSLATQDWGAVADALKNEAVAKLEADREALERMIAGVAQGSPQAVDLRAELARLDAQLTSAAQSGLASLQAEVTAAGALASDLRAQLRSDVLASNLPAEVLTNIYELQQNAELARTQYQTMLSRLRNLDTQAYLQVADSRVVSQALPPAQPSFPNPPLILTLSGLFGLGLGVVLAFLLENYVGGLTSEGQIEAVLRTRVAATVPRERAARVKPGEEGRTVADLITQSPLSAFAEALRRVRIGVDQAVRRHPPREAASGSIIMITSAAPNEGKTTISLALARAYALAGRSTLLIDCDLRKPRLHRYLNVAPSNALLDYLAGDGAGIHSLDPFMTVDPDSGVQVITGSRRSDVSTDQLITGKAFSSLIDAASKSFDIVILDTPPVGPVVDGLYLAPLADVIVFVVRWSSTSQRDGREAVTGLDQAKRPDTEIVAVLNQNEHARHRYYSRYGSYYDGSAS